ncbi:MAG: hypothetical protein N2Z75_03785 [Meiothermus sp.]|nr:hypothetical protein [Meiothermus sp.]
MFDSLRIRQTLEQISTTEMELSPTEASDVALHMTDWLDDLEALVKFYQNPEALSPKEASQLLLGFLIHVPNHLGAAAKIYAGNPVRDVFKVGAVEQESSDSA